MWSAAPMEEKVLMPMSQACLRSSVLWPTVSMASTRMSKPPLSISGMVSSETSSSIGLMSMSGFIERALSQATCAFGLPMVWVVARICLFRLLPEKTSPSTTRILPIPARTIPSSTYPPTAPHPQRMTDAFLSFSIPSSPRRMLVLVSSLSLIRSAPSGWSPRSRGAPPGPFR